MSSSLESKSPFLPLIELPDLALVALVGACSAGKSTFAGQHFTATEVLSLDFFRALVSDEAKSLDATADALDCLLQVASKRLARGRLTVIDAPSLQPESRRRLVELARQHDVPAVAVVLDLPRPVLEARYLAGTDRPSDVALIGRQVAELRRTRDSLPREGFQQVWRLGSPEEVEVAQVRRVPLPVDERERHGPFDFIGDVHGCLTELRELLGELGYQVSGEKVTAPAGRTAVFVGDLVDRGPDSAGVLRLVMNMVAAGVALCVPGNHDEKLKRALDGKAVKPLHGLDVTLAQVAAAGEAFQAQVQQFIGSLVSHLVLDGGRVVVAHAGLPLPYQGRVSGRVLSFALYGDVDGRTDEQGVPLRRDWAADYSGEAFVIYGHTPVVTPQWVNRTLDIDTGCAFGGALTALRYPEMELRSVKAKAQYAVPSRPLLQLPTPDTFDEARFLEAGAIETRTSGRIQLKAGERAAALERAREASVDSRWCIYLPPTLSAVEPSTGGPNGGAGGLERPEEAFAVYRQQGLTEVICEEKPRGERAVLVVCRDAEAARQRFGVSEGEGSGCLYNGQGRSCFTPEQTGALLERVQQAVAQADLWQRLNTDWLVLDVIVERWITEEGEERLSLWLLSLLAAEGQIYLGQDQRHTLLALAQAGTQLFRRPEAREVTLGTEDEAQASAWWEALVQAGAMGLVIRPAEFIPAEARQVQPALEVRSPAALQQLYAGDETALPGLVRHRVRLLGAERARALRQFHLGAEALARFVDREGLARVWECVLGVLALSTAGPSATQQGTKQQVSPT